MTKCLTLTFAQSIWTNIVAPAQILFSGADTCFFLPLNSANNSFKEFLIFQKFQDSCGKDDEMIDDSELERAMAKFQQNKTKKTLKRI